MSGVCMIDLEKRGLAPWYDSFASCYSREWDSYFSLSRHHKLDFTYSSTSTYDSFSNEFLVRVPPRDHYFSGRDESFKSISHRSWKAREFELDSVLPINAIATPIAMSDYIRKNMKGYPTIWVLLQDRFHEEIEPL